MSSDASGGMPSDASGDRSGSRVIVLRQRLRDAMLTGVALTVPLIVTLVVLGFVANFVGGTIQPAVVFVEDTFDLGETPTVAVQVGTMLSITLVILGVGLTAELRSGGRIEQVFDDTMERIPGVGSVYTSFNQMSEMLLSNDSQSFQEVYLVEYPSAGSYTLAFLTAETPEFVVDPTGEDELVTLFVPMAPNPVMGGFVVHVSTDRVYEVEMSVEEGIRSIVTSGVALGDTAESQSPADGAAIGDGLPVDPADFVPQALTASDGTDESGGDD